MANRRGNPVEYKQPVEAAFSHQSGDAQKARRAHIIAREREPILQAGDAMPGGIKIRSCSWCVRAAQYVIHEAQHDENKERT